MEEKIRSLSKADRSSAVLLEDLPSIASIQVVLDAIKTYGKVKWIELFNTRDERINVGIVVFAKAHCAEALSKWKKPVISGKAIGGKDASFRVSLLVKKSEKAKKEISDKTKEDARVERAFKNAFKDNSGFRQFFRSGVQENAILIPFFDDQKRLRKVHKLWTEFPSFDQFVQNNLSKDNFKVDYKFDFSTKRPSEIRQEQLQSFADSQMQELDNSKENSVDTLMRQSDNFEKPEGFFPEKAESSSERKFNREQAIVEMISEFVSHKQDIQTSNDDEPSVKPIEKSVDCNSIERISEPDKHKSTTSSANEALDVSIEEGELLEEGEISEPSLHRSSSFPSRNASEKMDSEQEDSDDIIMMNSDFSEKQNSSIPKKYGPSLKRVQATATRISDNFVIDAYDTPSDEDASESEKMPVDEDLEKQKLIEKLRNLTRLKERLRKLENASNSKSSLPPTKENVSDSSNLDLISKKRSSPTSNDMNASDNVNHFELVALSNAGSKRFKQFSESQKEEISPEKSVFSVDDAEFSPFRSTGPKTIISSVQEHVPMDDLKPVVVLTTDINSQEFSSSEEFKSSLLDRAQNYRLIGDSIKTLRQNISVIQTRNSGLKKKEALLRSQLSSIENQLHMTAQEEASLLQKLQAQVENQQALESVIKRDGQLKEVHDFLSKGFLSRSTYNYGLTDKPSPLKTRLLTKKRKSKLNAKETEIAGSGIRESKESKNIESIYHIKKLKSQYSESLQGRALSRLEAFDDLQNLFQSSTMEILLEDLELKKSNLNNIGLRCDKSRLNARLKSSGLEMLHSFLFSPHFTSLGYSLNAPRFRCNIDPMKPLCRFDLVGTCKDTKCVFQHTRDFLLTDEALMSRLLGILDHQVSSELSKLNPGEFFSRIRTLNLDKNICSSLSYASLDKSNNTDKTSIEDNNISTTISIRKEFSMHNTLKPRGYRKDPEFPIQNVTNVSEGMIMVPQEEESTSKPEFLLPDARYFEVPSKIVSGDASENTFYESKIKEDPLDEDLWIQYYQSTVYSDEAAQQVIARAIDSIPTSEILWNLFLKEFAKSDCSLKEKQEMATLAISYQSNSIVLWEWLLYFQTTVEDKIFVCKKAVIAWISSSCFITETEEYSMLIYQMLILMLSTYVDSGFAEKALVLLGEIISLQAYVSFSSALPDQSSNISQEMLNNFFAQLSSSVQIGLCINYVFLGLNSGLLYESLDNMLIDFDESRVIPLELFSSLDLERNRKCNMLFAKCFLWLEPLWISPSPKILKALNSFFCYWNQLQDLFWSFGKECTPIQVLLKEMEKCLVGEFYIWYPSSNLSYSADQPTKGSLVDVDSSAYERELRHLSNGLAMSGYKSYSIWYFLLRSSIEHRDFDRTAYLFSILAESLVTDSSECLEVNLFNFSSFGPHRSDMIRLCASRLEHILHKLHSNAVALDGVFQLLSIFLFFFMIETPRQVMDRFAAFIASKPTISLSSIEYLHLEFLSLLCRFNKELDTERIVEVVKLFLSNEKVINQWTDVENNHRERILARIHDRAQVSCFQKMLQILVSSTLETDPRLGIFQLEMACSNLPNNLSIHLALERLYIYYHDFDSSRSLTKRLVKQFSWEPSLYISLAHLECLRGQVSTSMTTLQDGISKNPFDRSLYKELVEIARKYGLGNVDDTLSKIQERGLAPL